MIDDMKGSIGDMRSREYTSRQQSMVQERRNQAADLKSDMSDLRTSMINYRSETRPIVTNFRTAMGELNSSLQDGLHPMPDIRNSTVNPIKIPAVDGRVHSLNAIQASSAYESSSVQSLSTSLSHTTVPNTSLTNRFSSEVLVTSCSDDAAASYSDRVATMDFISRTGDLSSQCSISINPTLSTSLRPAISSSMSHESQRKGPTSGRRDEDRPDKELPTPHGSSVLFSSGFGSHHQPAYDSSKNVPDFSRVRVSESTLQSSEAETLVSWNHFQLQTVLN